MARGKNITKEEINYGKMLIQQGYTLSEVARRLGRSPAAMTKHFSGKDYVPKRQANTTDRVWKYLTEVCDDNGETTVTNTKIAESTGCLKNSVGCSLNRLYRRGIASVRYELDDSGVNAFRVINVIKPYENDEVEESVDKIEESNVEIDPVSEDKWETLYRQNDAIIVYLKKIESLLEEFNSKL